MNAHARRRRFEIGRIGDVTVVRFTDTRLLDEQNIQMLGDDLFQLFDDLNPRKLLLDSGNVEFMSSAAMGKFVALGRKLKAVQGELVLCNLTRDMLDVFKIFRLDPRPFRFFGAAFGTIDEVIDKCFGNPYRAAAFPAEARTDTVMILAKQMHESREFSAMPILADALQDAGYDNEEVLRACRDGSGPHVRGCWVCDLVLGKE